MARKKRSRRARAKSIPLAPVLPTAVLAIRAFQSSGSYGAKASHLVQHMTGYNVDTGDFSAAAAMPYWGATAVGVVAHKVANKVGLNNYVRKLTMGYLSI